MMRSKHLFYFCLKIKSVSFYMAYFLPVTSAIVTDISLIIAWQPRLNLILCCISLIFVHNYVDISFSLSSNTIDSKFELGIFQCKLIFLQVTNGPQWQLREHGCESVDAVDGSQAMLDQAREKGLYIHYYCAWVDQPKSIPVDESVLCFCQMILMAAELYIKISKTDQNSCWIENLHNALK